MRISIESEATQKRCKAFLHISSVEREQFLELIDDDKNLVMAATPARDKRYRHVRLFETEQRIDRAIIRTDLGKKSLSQRDERPVPRRREDHSPPGRREGDQPSTEKRALARSRRTDHGVQMRLLQFP